MNAIDIKLDELKKGKQFGLMTHAVIGYPNIGESLKLIEILAKFSDFLELQIPFSDPVADGETIMKVCEAALKNGMNTDKAFEMIERINPLCHPEILVEGSRPIPETPTGFFAEFTVKNRRNDFLLLRMTKDIPVLLMAYYNTIFRYGVDKFCKKASKVKVSGLIVPDIPPEEEKNEKFISTCLKYDIYPIRIVSPSSDIRRLRINAKFGRGFVYCVSHFGVTGTKTVVDKRLIDYLQKVKQNMKLPVAVGFGISKPEQIQKLKGIADIAIIGSEIIKSYDKGGIGKVNSFIRGLKEGTI